MCPRSIVYGLRDGYNGICVRINTSGDSTSISDEIRIAGNASCAEPLHVVDPEEDEDTDETLPEAEEISLAEVARVVATMGAGVAVVMTCEKPVT